MAINPRASAAAFLDQYGRFAKLPASVSEVRLYDANHAALQTLTRAQFDGLSIADKTAIRNLDSAAGIIDTSSKSNA